MKPIELTIQNFISYRGPPTVIDFSDYRCLFLISGNTGSGKTTIFDAMTYALFGEISAEETTSTGKSVKSGRVDCIRCENASDDDTMVELRFEHQGKTYTIRRGLGKRKDRSDGKYRYDKPFAVMTGDGLSLEKTTDIRDMVYELLGLDVKQWRNVVMLAQSQFMSFLKADTNTRTDILNKLFDTSRFESVAKRLEDMEKEERARCAESSNHLSEIFNSFDKPDSDIGRELTVLDGTDKYAEAENILDLFGRALENDESELAGIRESMEDLQDKLEESQKAYSEAERLCNRYAELRKNMNVLSKLLDREGEFETKRSDVDRSRKAAGQVSRAYEVFKKDRETSSRKTDALEKQKKRIPELEENRASREKELQAAKERDEEEQDLRDRAAKIEPLIGKYEELGKARKSKMELDKEIKTLNEKIASHKEKLERSEKEKTDIEGFIDENQNAGQQLEATLNLGERLQARKLGLEKLRSDYSALQISAKNREDALAAKEEMQKKSCEAETLYEDLLKRQTAHSAGVLAMKLQPGCRCPVCGSLEHPVPARLPDNVPSEKEIEAAKKAEKAVKNDLAEAAERFARDNQRCEDQKRSFDEELSKAEIEPSDNILSAIDEEISKVSGQYEICHKDIESLKKLMQDVVDARFRVDELKAEIDGLRHSMETDGADLKEKEKDASISDNIIRNLSKELSEFDSESEAKKAMVAFRMQADGLKQALDDADGAFNDASNKLNLCRNSIKEMSTDLENLKVTESQSRSHYERVRSEAGFTDEAEFLHYLSIHDGINELENEISEYNDTCVSVRTTVENLKAEIDGRPEPEDLEAYRLRKDDCANALTKAGKLEGLLQNRIGTNRKTEKKFRETYDGTKKAKEHYDMVAELAMIYRGNRGTGVKISFNQYVLGEYLDAIVINATRRLKEMSSGRYELRRVAKATSTQGSNALDLDIFDNHNCHSRSINTLSGGEAFMTALSLSLSISDTVQSSARGKTVEGLFIDEGFGTLDDNTRNLAVNTLKKMSGDRISIGIISHVEDLKSNIEKGMEVSYDPSSGSRIRFY